MVSSESYFSHISSALEVLRVDTPQDEEAPKKGKEPMQRGHEAGGLYKSGGVFCPQVFVQRYFHVGVSFCRDPPPKKNGFTFGSPLKPTKARRFSKQTSRLGSPWPKFGPHACAFLKPRALVKEPGLHG